MPEPPAHPDLRRKAYRQPIWEPGNTVGSAVMVHFFHDTLHFGMMECLLGLQSSAGPAAA